MNRLLQLVALAVLVISIQGFLPHHSVSSHMRSLLAETSGASTGNVALEDPNDIVARRIIVKGNVQGGYYRSCVLNEAGRFRRLIGTMTPPDDSDIAEIYVEGKRKMVDGFVRWCKKGNVGLSQVVAVESIADEEPTGLYDGFYVKTK